MKVLFICQHYYPENFVIYKIAEFLQKQGHEVDVLTGQPNYGYGQIVSGYEKVFEENINGVNVHRVKLYPRKKSRLSIIRNYLSFWRNSKKWVKKCKTKYDLVYSMSLSPVTILSAGDLYKKKFKVKHVVHCVDLWPESACAAGAVKKNSLIYKILYKWSHDLYKQVDEIIVGSPSFSSYFDDVLKLGHIKTTFICQPSLIEESDIEPYKFDNSYFNILYCGNLGRLQLINLIPESMKLLKDKKVRFHVIGMGPKNDELNALIKEYGLENTVINHGPIISSKACAYFKSVDALYVSLKNDGPIGKTIPNKLVMSMAFAKPIIAVLSGDGRALLEESKGAVFADEDAKSVSKAIETISELNKEKLSEMGVNNLTYFRQNLSIDITGKKIEEELLKNI